MVAGLLQVDDARRHVALVETPLARLAAQPGDRVGLAPLELGPEELAEELVVAIPLAAIVLGRDEEVLVGQAREHRLSVAPAGDGVAEGRREMLHHRGAQQEVLGVGCLGREHLAEQVAGDLAPVATHDRRPLVGRPAADGDGRQIQSGRPALGGP